MSTFARGGLAVVAIVSILGGVASGAAVLTTAPLELEGPNSFSCLISNVGTKDVEASLTIVNASGTPVFSSPVPVMLTPLHGTGVGGLAATQHPRFCQTTVLQGGKKSVRASACILDPGGTCIANSEAH